MGIKSSIDSVTDPDDVEIFYRFTYLDRILVFWTMSLSVMAYLWIVLVHSPGHFEVYSRELLFGLTVVDGFLITPVVFLFFPFIRYIGRIVRRALRALVVRAVGFLGRLGGSS